MMKPSTSLSKEATKMGPQTRSGNVGQVSTLYLATCGLLVVAAAVVSATTVAATAAASKSGQRSQVVANDARPSSSSSLNTDNVASDKDDHRLALASSTTSAQLVPVRHFKSEVSGRSSSRSTDLTIGQSNIANAKIQVSAKDMATAAGHHYGGGGKSHGKYYMYAESPKKGAYKMGFKRGNHKHMIERKESAHKGHVHGYFKWHDKKGKGSHKYEFKHYDKKGKHHHY